MSLATLPALIGPRKMTLRQYLEPELIPAVIVPQNYRRARLGHPEAALQCNGRARKPCAPFCYQPWWQQKVMAIRGVHFYLVKCINSEADSFLVHIVDYCKIRGTIRLQASKN